MASPERSFREKAGINVRNISLGIALLGAFFAPEIVIPAIVLAGTGEIFSKNSHPQE